MNVIEVIADNKFSIKSFDTKICNCLVAISSSAGKIAVVIKGRKSAEKIVNLALDILSMFFLYQGFYPTIESIKCNGFEYKINLAGRFFTSGRFKKTAQGIISR